MYTKTGDDGKTGLYADTARYPKDSEPFEALGTLDELNALVGICRAHAHTAGEEDMVGRLATVQESLFIIQAEVAGAPKKITRERIAETEGVINGIENRLGNPGSFLIPGATVLSGFLDLARSVARRAERTVITAARTRTISRETRIYLNRLSSLLYALARSTVHKEGAAEAAPTYK